MKTSYIVGLIVIVIIVGGGLWYATSAHSSVPAVPSTSTVQPGGTDQSVTQPVQTNPATGVSAQVTATPVAATVAKLPARSFAVNGNDATADLKTIKVAAGTPVTIVFGADAGTTYHGGLDFRSSVVNTGTIAPGSTKSVSFTATKSFSFTPYWPATNIAKPYTIDIVVQ